MIGNVCRVVLKIYRLKPLEPRISNLPAEHGLKQMQWVPLGAAAASVFWLAGCVNSTPPRVVAQPAPQPARPVVVVAAPPAQPAPPVVVVRPAVQEQVVSEPNDIYVAAALDSDIVFAGGNTYIWITGPDGHRHRHLYGHGDRRQEIFRRRDNLHSVMAHRGAPPPMRDARAMQNHRLEAIRRDQLHREEEARLARAHASDRGHMNGHGYAQANGRPNGIHHGNAPEHHAAANGAHPAPARPMREASAEHSAPTRHPGDAGTQAQGNPHGKS